jgi:hypothetical protein
MVNTEVSLGDQPCQCGTGIQCFKGSPVSIIRGYVMSVMFAHYIHTQSCHLAQPRWCGEWWTENCGTGLRRNAQLRSVTDGLVLRVWSMYCIPYECGKMYAGQVGCPSRLRCNHMCCIYKYTDHRSQWWQMMVTEMVSGTCNNSTFIISHCAGTMKASNHI